MKVKKQKETLNSLARNLAEDKNNIVRAKGSICLGSNYPIMNENALANEYKQEIKKQIKYLRDYPNGMNQRKDRIEISGKFSPAFLEYRTKIPEKTSVLYRTGWSTEKTATFNPEIIIEIPFSTAQQINEKDLFSYMNQIDKNIQDKIKEKQNTLIGKIKRKSFKDIHNFPKIELAIKYEHPRIKTFENRGADCISGPWNPEAENWKLD